MSGRLYLCDIIGDGTEANPHRPALADIPGITWYGSLPTVDGVPKNSVTLTVADAPDHTEVRALSGVDPLPVREVSRDSLDQTEKDDLSATLTRRGIEGVPLDGEYRETIMEIERQLNASPKVRER